MFELNKSAKYPVGAKYKSKQYGLVNHIIYINEKEKFGVKMMDIFKVYRLEKVNSEIVRERWYKEPMRFWQNQPNFAIWAAKAGCGVPLEVKTNNYMVNSFYKFHIYYTIRKILRELNVPLPNDDAFDPVDNIYNKDAFEFLSNEFNVPTQEKWHIFSANDGMGFNFYRIQNEAIVTVPLRIPREQFNPKNQTYKKRDKHDHRYS